MYCLQVNELLIDVTEGLHQEYVQDCEICCRPNLLIITIDPELRSAEVEVDAP